MSRKFGKNKAFDSFIYFIWNHGRVCKPSFWNLLRYRVWKPSIQTNIKVKMQGQRGYYVTYRCLVYRKSHHCYVVITILNSRGGAVVVFQPFEFLRFFYMSAKVAFFQTKKSDTLSALSLKIFGKNFVLSESADISIDLQLWPLISL